MKKNVQIQFGVIAALSLTLTVVITYVANQKQQEINKLGPLAWAEIESVRAGTGEGEGCGETPQTCEIIAGPTRPTCNCLAFDLYSQFVYEMYGLNAWDFAEFNVPFVKEYAGESFKSVSETGIGTDSLLSHNLAKPCSRTISCDLDTIQDGLICGYAPPRCTTTAAIPSDICIQWSSPSFIPDWETFIHGECMDP